jgi:Glycosyltransferase sugar-binding region containing DXD motif
MLRPTELGRLPVPASNAQMRDSQHSVRRSPSISQYWDADVVPDSVAGLIATFRDRNPDFRHRLLSEAETERFIADRFGAREVAAFQACAIPSMQSDYFRYCSVLALGGIYADVDYRCKGSLLPLLDCCAGGEVFLGPTVHPLNGRETRRVWSGFFVFREPGHPFLRLALEIATANVEARIPERLWPIGEKVRESIWLTVGPGVPTLMRFMREWGSFDAFIEGIAGSPAEPYGKLYCEVVGEHDRVVEAFEGVRVSQYESMMKWIEEPGIPLSYKETDAHWHNVQTAIFR